MIHSIYASAATDGFSEHQIPALLEHTRRANAARGITGMLLYVERSFFQVLEGDAAGVDSLFATIAADTRHKHVTLIIREPIPRRDFGDWTMGFANIGPEEVGEMIGENDFFGSGSCLENLGTGRTKKLLAAFRSGRWHLDQTRQLPAYDAAR